MTTGRDTYLDIVDLFEAYFGLQLDRTGVNFHVHFFRRPFGRFFGHTNTFGVHFDSITVTRVPPRKARSKWRPPHPNGKTAFASTAASDCRSKIDQTIGLWTAQCSRWKSATVGQTWIPGRREEAKRQAIHDMCRAVQVNTARRTDLWLGRVINGSWCNEIESFVRPYKITWCCQGKRIHSDGRNVFW